MISYIAISAEIELFKNERILDPIWAKKFPGALWMSILANALYLKGIKVTTGDVALSNVENDKWEAKSIGIIQHIDDPVTEKLIMLGAQPLVLTCFESQLYVPNFYNIVSDIANKFKHRVMFSGMLKNLPTDTGINHSLRFPSYNNEDIKDIIPWQNKRFLTMVVGNKYEASLSPVYLKTLPDSIKLLKRIASLIIKHKNLKVLRFNWKLNNSQLQDQRISAILFFGRMNLLKLYGKGWKDLKNLPYFYRKQFKQILDNLKPELCEDKLKTIREFQFVLCFENFKYPGYITEKIIECFVAGVVPVYLGASDVCEFIPSNAFINASNYSTWEDLLSKLNSIEPKEADYMISNGRNFLSSEQARSYTYEGFATFMEQLILQCNTESKTN